MDLTASTRALAAAVSESAKLSPGALSAVLLRANADGLTLVGADSERWTRLTCEATTHVDGDATVPVAPLAEMLRMLDAAFVRIVVEGSRLAVRVDGARFALPLLDKALHHTRTTPPPKVADVDGAALAAALRTVAATASHDDTLPLFTGVRLHIDDGKLNLVASDRYRMAVAKVPLLAVTGSLDALVPATLLVEIARQAKGIVGVHTEHGRFGLSWSGNTVSTAVLDGGFLSASSIATSSIDTTVEVRADVLSAAVRRVGMFADTRRVLTLEVGDGQLRLASSKQDTGEAEEMLKANVLGGRTSPSFQARYLVDALQPFGGAEVRLGIQPGRRATVIRATDPGEFELTYLVMPTTHFERS
jgi:DNA polymerase-3 subunit beta